MFRNFFKVNKSCINLYILFCPIKGGRTSFLSSGNKLVNEAMQGVVITNCTLFNLLDKYTIFRFRAWFCNYYRGTNAYIPCKSQLI